jgi:uncharacterized protein (UPF0332 family)
MSPRSEEFIEQARDRLVAAREALEAAHRGVAVSVAYYAMLYAARAMLSEDDENARSHRGTWNLFRVKYVTNEAFEAALFTLAQHAQVAREGGDYAAVIPSEAEARRYVDGAAEFLAAAENLLGARPGVSRSSIPLTQTARTGASEGRIEGAGRRPHATASR